MKETKNTPGGINKKTARVLNSPNTGKDKADKEKPKKDQGTKKEAASIKKDVEINTNTVKIDENIDKSISKTETYDIEKTKARQEVVKRRQAEIAPLLGDPNNKDLIQEYDELIKESLSIEKRLNEVKVETPELEQTTEESDLTNKEAATETIVDEKTQEKEKIVVIKEIKNGEEVKENVENKKIELELDKNLEIARNKYIEEYKKCKKESDKESLITKTKNKILNIFRSKENKINTKVEDFFTKELEESKKAYDKARIEKGNYMYMEKKVELEKAGLLGEDLKNALINYKATEILAKTIIEERQKLIDMKADGSPIKPALWKRLIDGYMSIKPRWKRVALSTMIFLPLAGFGAVGAAAFSSGIAATAGLAAVKFGTSMAIGAGVGQLSKGIDWAKKGSDIKFREKQIEDKQKLKEKFSEGKIDLKQYETQLAIYEEEERRRNRNRMITKGVVGGALAIAAGFVAYDAMGHGVEHLKGIHNSVDAVTGPDVSNHINTPNIIGHANVEATADHGQGAIATLRELQHNLKIEYGNDLNNAPVSVKHILNTDAHKLAQEYGMYKPGQDAESAFIKSGSSFRVDSHGNLTYHAMGVKNDLVFEHGTDVKASSLYEGKMSDTDHSGVKESFKAPEQVDMETGRPIITHGEGDNIKVDGNQFKAPEQVDMETGKPIVPNNTDLNNSKIDLISNGNSVKFENFNFGNGDHILSLNENGSSLRMQFIYNNHGKIIDVDAVGNTYNTGSNPYTLEGELEKLEKYKRLDADVDIMKMTSNARFLDKLPHNTHEYRFLSEKVAGMQKEIIDNYGNVINPDKLINSPSINIPTENLNVDNNLTPEVLEKVHTTLNENVKHLFPNEKSIELWNNAKNNVSAERFMELNKGGEVLDSYKPLFSYMDKLEKISGATPIGETLLHKAESMPDYILRATKIIAEKGELDKIKL